MFLILGCTFLFKYESSGAFWTRKECFMFCAVSEKHRGLTLLWIVEEAWEKIENTKWVVK